jgi:hypothetical protein
VVSVPRRTCRAMRPDASDHEVTRPQVSRYVRSATRDTRSAAAWRHRSARC